MPVSTYSSGMLMQLAFAIVTHSPADIVVMDEWLSVGDAEFRGKAEERMRGMVDRSGILAVATHSEELVSSECGRVVRLSHGQLRDRERSPTSSGSFPDEVPVPVILATKVTAATGGDR